MAKRRRFSEEGFGETVQRLMDEQGVTYRQLAGRTGLSAGYLNHVVHGNQATKRFTQMNRAQNRHCHKWTNLNLLCSLSPRLRGGKGRG